jgi:hypothetical protein
MTARWTGTLVLVLLVAGMTALAWWRRRSDQPYVSTDWLRHQLRGEREHFDGVHWRWPVNKVVNEHARWNANRLRKRA